MNARDFDDVPRDLSECDHDERYLIEISFPRYPGYSPWYPVGGDNSDAFAAQRAALHQMDESRDFNFPAMFRVYDTVTDTVVWPAKKTT